MNNYYHKYTDAFVEFLIPKDKLVMKLKYGVSEVPQSGSESDFEYIVIKDAVAHVGDVQKFLCQARDSIVSDGRIVMTQYSSLWEPLLVCASKIGLRMPIKEQNWLSLTDLKNFAYLSDLEVVKSGTKMIMPVYIPLISAFLNKFLSNIFPFSKLGIFHYLVLKKNTKNLENTKPSISIIVPARNEAGTIEKIVRELPLLGSFTEIVLIEGNSTDNTWEVMQKVAAEYKGDKRLKCAKQSGKGKGDAVRKGFDMAEGDILMIYDADMTVPANEIYKFYDAIVMDHGEFINGSRLVYPMDKESMRFFNILGNKFFSFAFSTILGQQLKDTLCGTKVLWKKDYEEIKKNRAYFGDFDPFGDFDLIFGAAKLNLKIIDMPVHYKERIYGTTNISRWSHGWLLLKMTIFAARKIKFI